VVLGLVRRLPEECGDRSHGAFLGLDPREPWRQLVHPGRELSVGGPGQARSVVPLQLRRLPRCPEFLRNPRVGRAVTGSARAELVVVVTEGSSTVDAVNRRRSGLGLRGCRGQAQRRTLFGDSQALCYKLCMKPLKSLFASALNRPKIFLRHCESLRCESSKRNLCLGKLPSRLFETQRAQSWCLYCFQSLNPLQIQFVIEWTPSVLHVAKRRIKTLKIPIPQI